MLPPGHGQQWDKGAEMMGIHLRNIGLPVLAVFCVLIGVAITVYCAHLIKVKLAWAITHEQYLSNYNYSEMNAVADNRAKSTSTAIIIDRRDQAGSKGGVNAFEDLGFSQFPNQKEGNTVKGEGGPNSV